MTKNEKRPEKKREKGVGYLYNPKLVKGTKIIDCIPQAGKCLLAASHDCGIDCYFMHGWYDPTYKPIIPPEEEARGKIIRFNSGNDSNVEKELVLETAKNFKDFFFNTSLKRLDFLGPVVFTCNSKRTNEFAYTVKAPDNLMFVRFRTNSWNLALAESVIAGYEKQNVPVVLTFMRYLHEGRIPPEFRENYEFKTSLMHDYFMINKEKREEIFSGFLKKYRNVSQCGTYESSYCKDCGNCEKLYYRAKERMKKK